MYNKSNPLRYRTPSSVGRTGDTCNVLLVVSHTEADLFATFAFDNSHDGVVLNSFPICNREKSRHVRGLTRSHVRLQVCKVNILVVEVPYDILWAIVATLQNLHVLQDHRGERALTRVARCRGRGKAGQEACHGRTASSLLPKPLRFVGAIVALNAESEH